MAMKGDDSFHKFQGLIFQEIEAQKRMATQAAVDDFIAYAGTRGFTLDRLIDMASSGMSGRTLFDAVHSN
jgi:hypothetical protein